MDSTFELLCIGNAVVDVFAKVDGDFFGRFGLEKAVEHCDSERVERLLAAIPHYTACSGGGAANVAKIAGLIGLKTAFIGTIGADSTGSPDSFASFFRQEIANAGVKLYVPAKNASTGICLILQNPERETRIIAAPSAAQLLEPSDIPEFAIKQSHTVVLDGYILDRKEFVQNIFDQAEESGTEIALDVGSVDIVKKYAADIARYCTSYHLILFMNEAESLAYVDSEYEDTSESVAFFKRLTAHGFPVVAVKKAGKGASVFANGIEYRIPTRLLFPRESTGAGDAFCAGFLAAWIRSRSVEECAKVGHKVASIVLDIPGTDVGPAQAEHLARIFP
ncbi:adenosine kinase [Spirochaetia bacterium]|nr:adenosine kinase [Spirochaetia bacterium]